MFNNYKSGYENLWKAIIRPPRDIYSIKDLGPNLIVIGQMQVQRTDIQLKNQRNMNLECSFFQPRQMNQPLPCVIYLHGNSSCRLEALSTIETLLSQKIQLFCFDFSGSGLSEGEYISLGHYEKFDVECAINYLRSSNQVTTIGLWGRSMGGITALMYANQDPSIAGMVVDSAMTDLKTLAEELCKTYVTLPSFVLSGALALVKKSVQDRANFNIYDLKPIEHVKESFVPILFAAAKNDTFILPSHTQKLYQEYAGDKNIIMIEGDHNSPRPQFFYDSVAIFFYNTLQCNLIQQNAVKDSFDLKSQVQSEQIQKQFNLKAQNINFINKLNGDNYEDNEEQQLNRAIEESLKIQQSDNQQKGKQDKK